jgi:hypothetical protein
VSLKTVGIAPKTIVATALPLDDTIWWTLIGSSPLLGGGTYAAPAAPTAMRKVGKRGEAGLTFIEVILVLLVIVAVVLLIRIF